MRNLCIFAKGEYARSEVQISTPTKKQNMKQVLWWWEFLFWARQTSHEYSYTQKQNHEFELW